MGKRGPKRTPTGVLLARGSWRGTERIESEPGFQPYQRPPSPPACLGRSAKTEWRRIVPILMGQRILSPADRASLVGYCQAWGQMVDTQKILDKEGLTCPTPGGGIGVHPAVRIQADARRSLKSYAALFGLNPADRSNVRNNGQGETTTEKADPQSESTESFIRRPA